MYGIAARGAALDVVRRQARSTVASVAAFQRRPEKLERRVTES